MESQYSDHLLMQILKQIDTSIDQLEEWNSSICCADDYRKSGDGMKTLAATSMLLEAIGEGIKKIDKRTSKQLLLLRPEIPWADVMGIRDHIAHGYFDIDADIIFDTVKTELTPLRSAIRFFIGYIGSVTL